MISGKDWLVQHNTHLDFQFECCMFYKGHCEVTMQMNLVQTQSNPQTHCHAIQTVNSEGQLTTVGDDPEPDCNLPITNQKNPWKRMH